MFVFIQWTVINIPRISDLLSKRFDISWKTKKCFPPLLNGITDTVSGESPLSIHGLSSTFCPRTMHVPTGLIQRLLLQSDLSRSLVWKRSCSQLLSCFLGLILLQYLFCAANLTTLRNQAQWCLCCIFSYTLDTSRMLCSHSALWSAPTLEWACCQHGA